MTPAPGYIIYDIFFVCCSAARVWPEVFALLFSAIFPTDRALIFLRRAQHISPSMSPILRERKSPDFLSLLSIS